MPWHACRAGLSASIPNSIHPPCPYDPDAAVASDAVGCPSGRPQTERKSDRRGVARSLAEQAGDSPVCCPAAAYSCENAKPPPIGLNRFRRRASQHGQRGRVWLRGQDCAQVMVWVAWPEFLRPASTLASLRASSFFLFFEAAGPAASLSSSIRSASACCLASSSLRMRSVSGLVALLVLCCKLVNTVEGAQLVPYRF